MKYNTLSLILSCNKTQWPVSVLMLMIHWYTWVLCTCYISYNIPNDSPYLFAIFSIFISRL